MPDAYPALATSERGRQEDDRARSEVAREVGNPPSATRLSDYRGALGREVVQQAKALAAASARAGRVLGFVVAEALELNGYGRADVAAIGAGLTKMLGPGGVFDWDAVPTLAPEGGVTSPLLLTSSLDDRSAERLCIDAGRIVAAVREGRLGRDEARDVMQSTALVYGLDVEVAEAQAYAFGMAARRAHVAVRALEWNEARRSAAFDLGDPWVVQGGAQMEEVTASSPTPKRYERALVEATHRFYEQKWIEKDHQPTSAQELFLLMSGEMKMSGGAGSVRRTLNRWHNYRCSLGGHACPSASGDSALDDYLRLATVLALTMTPKET